MEFGTEAWSKRRRTSLYIIGIRNELLPSLVAAQRRFKEILQTIVLWRAARRPAHWDEWLIRPSDRGIQYDVDALCQPAGARGDGEHLGRGLRMCTHAMIKTII